MSEPVDWKAAWHALNHDSGAEIARLRAENAALKERDSQWQRKWARAVGTGTSNTLREADRADRAEAEVAALRAENAALTAALRGAHLVLQACDAVIDPEVHADLSGQIEAVLLPCSEAGHCPTLRKAGA